MQDSSVDFLLLWLSNITPQYLCRNWQCRHRSDTQRRYRYQITRHGRCVGPPPYHPLSGSPDRTVGWTILKPLKPISLFLYQACIVAGQSSTLAIYTLYPNMLEFPFYHCSERISAMLYLRGH